MKSYLQNTILVLTGIVLSLILLELLLTLFYPQDSPLDAKVFRTMEYHPLLGWFNKPNVHETGALCKKRYAVTTNKQGFRGTSDYVFEKKSGVKRIIVFGDSQIFGLFQDDDETYASHLQKQLGESYEVLNFGVDGYGTDQEMILFTKTVEEYDPDIVIFAFFQNDLFNIEQIFLTNEAARGQKPIILSVNKTNVKLGNCCPVRNVVNETTITTQKFSSFFQSYLFFEKAYYSLFSSALNVSFFQDYNEVERTQANENIIARYSKESSLGASHIGANFDKAYTLLFSIYDHLLFETKSRNITFVVLNIPSNTQVDPITREEFFKRYNDVQLSNFEKDRVNKKIASYMKNKTDIVYIDLFDIFESEGTISAKKQNIFYPCSRDTHWNSLGAKRGAKETIDQLRKEGIV